MKKVILSLLLAVCANNAFADDVSLRLLNCTGTAVTANWLGFKTNVDSKASDSVLSGQIVIPAKQITIIKNLNILRVPGSRQEGHSFVLNFVQGASGKVEFLFQGFVNGGETISLTSSENIYLPNTSIYVTSSKKPAADIQIGCQ
ncbi:MAG: hypothetical protein M3R00_02345 [Pseudomonadota bacterium]|nr:hypothetical protein [Pseudomonadota bacterium]